MSSHLPGHLYSPRLVLRPLQPDDAEPLCSYRALPEVARYQSWESFGQEDAVRLINGQKDREPDVPGTWFQLAIIEKATGTMLGDCGLHCPLDEPRQMEFGITLAPSHQGRGYATETLRCLLQHAFTTLGKHRVYAYTDVENNASSALFRRLGFRQEAHHIEHRWFKGAWQSELVFALLKREWEPHAQPNREFAP
ncbi:MAG: GNAT family N-acetyltransferase [Prosthecobacter sp.]